MILRTTIVLSALVASSTVYASAAVDERIHMCDYKDKERHLLGKGPFRVHVKVDEFIKVTRMKSKDRKFIRMVPSQSGANTYVPTHTKEGGDLWTRGAYMFDVDQKKKELVIALQASDNAYDLTTLDCQLVATISKPDPMSETEKRLSKIASDIEVGNGGWEVTKIDPKKFSLDVERRALRKMQFKDCTWEFAEGLTEVNTLLNKSESGQQAIAKLKSLRPNPGIDEILATTSDNDIACSRAYIYLFTKDYYKLELLIDFSD